MSIKRKIWKLIIRVQVQDVGELHEHLRRLKTITKKKRLD
jgi:hypothetical protein